MLLLLSLSPAAAALVVSSVLFSLCGYLTASLSSHCTRQALVFLRHRRFPAPALRFPAGAHVVVNRWPPGSIRTGRRRAAARVRRRSCTCVGQESPKLAPTAARPGVGSWDSGVLTTTAIAGRNARTRQRRTTVCSELIPLTWLRSVRPAPSPRPRRTPRSLLSVAFLLFCKPPRSLSRWWPKPSDQGGALGRRPWPDSTPRR